MFSIENKIGLMVNKINQQTIQFSSLFLSQLIVINKNISI